MLGNCEANARERGGIVYCGGMFTCDSKLAGQAGIQFRHVLYTASVESCAAVPALGSGLGREDWECA